MVFINILFCALLLPTFSLYAMDKKPQQGSDTIASDDVFSLFEKLPRDVQKIIVTEMGLSSDSAQNHFFSMPRGRNFEYYAVCKDEQSENGFIDNMPLQIRFLCTLKQKKILGRIRRICSITGYEKRLIEGLPEESLEYLPQHLKITLKNNTTTQNIRAATTIFLSWPATHSYWNGFLRIGLMLSRLVFTIENKPLIAQIPLISSYLMNIATHYYYEKAEESDNSFCTLNKLKIPFCFADFLTKKTLISAGGFISIAILECMASKSYIEGLMRVLFFGICTTNATAINLMYKQVHYKNTKTTIRKIWEAKNKKN